MCGLRESVEGRVVQVAVVPVEQDLAGSGDRQGSLVAGHRGEARWRPSLGRGEINVLGTFPVRGEHYGLPVRSPDGFRLVGLVAGYLHGLSAAHGHGVDVALIAESYGASVRGNGVTPYP